MTLKGGTSQACAACKYQRRKCTPECPLAPYFPPDQPKMFQNVHRLFGVKKIQRLLQVLPPISQNEAMSSIIYQANIRERYPVYGCCEVIHLLKNEIRKCEEELYAVQAMLAMYRQQQDQQQMSTDITTSHLHLAPPTNDAQTFYLQNSLVSEPYSTDDIIPVAQNISYSNSNNPCPAYNLDAKDAILWIQQPGNNDMNTSAVEHPLPINSQMVVSQEPTTPEQDEYQQYEEMRPYFCPDQQSYIDPNEAYILSPEPVVKDTTHFREHVGENDLKSAAACFSLTSVQVN